MSLENNSKIRTNPPIAFVVGGSADRIRSTDAVDQAGDHVRWSQQTRISPADMPIGSMICAMDGSVAETVVLQAASFLKRDEHRPRRPVGLFLDLFLVSFAIAASSSYCYLYRFGFGFGPGCLAAAAVR